MSANDIFDRIATSSPVNRGAGLAVSGASVHYDPKITKTREIWDAPPAMRPVPPDAPALVGFKFGRMTVVGMLAETNGRYARWLVRCVCGKYEARRAAVITGKHAALSQCQVCDHLDSLRRIDRVRQFGTERANKMQDEDRAVVMREASAKGQNDSRAQNTVVDGAFNLRPPKGPAKKDERANPFQRATRSNRPC